MDFARLSVACQQRFKRTLRDKLPTLDAIELAALCLQTALKTT